MAIRRFERSLQLILSLLLVLAMAACGGGGGGGVGAGGGGAAGSPETAAAPRFGLSPGVFSTAQSVTISTSTPGASIRYTLGNTTPSGTSGTLYTGAIPLGLNSTTTIRAVAFKAGYADSPVTAGTFTITGTVAAPTFDLPPGTYVNPKRVALSTSTAGATIRYTLDNTTPTATYGAVYSGPIPLVAATTIKAIACRADWADSAVVSSEYALEFVQVAAKESHTVALKPDGTVWSWGGNVDGQLGDGTTKGRYRAVQVVGPGGTGVLTGVMAVSAGTRHTVALKSDGTVWAWGNNLVGTLGVGSTTNSATPVQVVGPGGAGFLTDVAAISAGNQHTVALKTDGTVWAWGGGLLGQIGNGTSTSSTTPVQVVGPGGIGVLTGVVAVAAGDFHTVALKTDGTAWTWGSNNGNALGTGTFSMSSATPAQVVGPGGIGFLTGVAAISGGYAHTVALKTDGTVWAWGANDHAQLGNGSTATVRAPVQVVGPGGIGFLTGVAAISGGYAHSVALKSDGTVWAWGYGPLGNVTTSNSATPVQAVGPGGSGALTGVVSVCAGGKHTVALRSDGTVWAWGWNGYGQLGLGGDGKTPSPVVGPGGSGLLTGATGVAAGYYFSVALKSDNTVWGWGSNDAGQLGNGTLASSDTPRQVVGPGGSGVLTDVAAISGGYSHTAALRTDGTVWAWGLNIYGQLGDGSTGYSRTPVQVVGPEGNGVMTGVSAIAAGFWHTVALRPDGTVWTWGSNSNGQLGNGAAANSATPVQVLGPGGSGVLTDVVAISAGGFHTVALKSDGTVWAWGVNTEAELGNASAMYSSATPLQVAGPDGVGNLTGVAAISAGSRYTVALKTDGTVCAWGTGPSGSGVYSRMTAPVQIPGPGGAGVLTEVVAVSAGFDQVVAIRADNSVWTWGSNYGGQLGDGTTTDHLAPIQVAGLDGSGILTGAIAGAAGYLHTLALKSDGTVWLWGTNLYGQLGHPDGYSAPVQSLSASGAPFVVSDSGRILSAAMARDFGGPVQGGSDKSGGGCAIAKHPGDGSGTAVCLLAVLLGLRFGRRFRARRERRASGVGVSP